MKTGFLHMRLPTKLHEPLQELHNVHHKLLSLEAEHIRLLELQQQCDEYREKHKAADHSPCDDVDTALVQVQSEIEGLRVQFLAVGYRVCIAFGEYTIPF